MAWRLWFLGVFLFTVGVKGEEPQRPTLNFSQLQELEQLGKLSLANQIKYIRSKAKVILVGAVTKPRISHFDSLGPATQSVNDIPDMEGRFGKVTCGDNQAIMISEDAPGSILFHQYVHFLQIQNDPRWCDFEQRPLTKDERRLQAIMYHRMEADLLKIFWEHREKFSLGVADRLLILEGLKKESEILSDIGEKVLPPESLTKAYEELAALKSQIVVKKQLNLDRGDVGSQFQKLEILALRNCVEQTDKAGSLDAINLCLKERCKLSGITCRGLDSKDLAKTRMDTVDKVIYSWVNPHWLKQCPIQTLKEELMNETSQPSDCWKKWYLSRNPERKTLFLTPSSREEFKKLYKVSDISIENKVNYYRAKSPDVFIHKAYCYHIFAENESFDQRPLAEFGYATQVISLEKKKVGEFTQWLDHTEKGQACRDIVKSATGIPPSVLSYYVETKPFAVIINPVASLSTGVPHNIESLKTAVHHELLHLVYSENPELRQRVQKKWDSMTEDLRNRFLEKHPIKEKDSLMREFLSFSYQDNPSGL